MDRRTLLLSAMSGLAGCAHASPRGRRLPGQVAVDAGATRWRLRQSEAYDAICFWAALAGQPMQERYAHDAAAFAPRLPAESIAFLREAFRLAETIGANLVHSVCRFFSPGPDARIDDLLISLDDIDGVLRPEHAADEEWEGEEMWARFKAFMPEARPTLVAMRDADFAAFWRERAETEFTVESARVARVLRRCDLVAEIARLTGRAYRPEVEVVLAHYAYPTSMKLLGQKLVTWPGYSADTLVSVTAHEMMHPPLDLDGEAMRAATAALAYLEDFARESGEGDLANYLEECLVQALDQIAAARLGARVDPAAYFSRLGGRYAVGAAFYGWLVEDGWERTGGDLSPWLARCVERGQLERAVLVAAAEAVLGRPISQVVQ
jgi:hypothetical protein